MDESELYASIECAESISLIIENGKI